MNKIKAYYQYFKLRILFIQSNNLLYTHIINIFFVSYFISINLLIIFIKVLSLIYLLLIIIFINSFLLILFNIISNNSKL